MPAGSAGFQTCCIADFQVGRLLENARPAGLETRDTADLEVCATVAVLRCARSNLPDDKFVFICIHSWLNFCVKIITDERCAGYAYPGHPERPLRILATLDLLRNQTDLPIEWAEPGRVSDAQILRAHSANILRA